MPKLNLFDDILAPRDTILVKFQGKNPYVAATIVQSVLKEIMKIPGKDILETDVRWDAAGETRAFYGKWMGKKQEDNWTKTWIRIVIQGEQHATERTGWCNIELKGTIRTTYEYNNFIQRMFWWFYNKSFYYKQRRMYAEDAKDTLFEMRDKFQSVLGIAPR
jgi:hypothetical protein